ncbi:MAG: hemolysin family protein [Treponema sp.]
MSIIVVLEFLILVFLAGFFSCTETAITAITEAEYNKIKKVKREKEKRITYLIDKKEKIISTTLIATNFINILTSSIITVFTIKTLGATYLPLTTVITTISIIIFAEIIPKTLATHYAMNIIKKTSWLLYICYFLNYPIVLVFSYLSKIIVSFIRMFHKEVKHKMTEDELKEIFNISREDGALVNLEHTLLKKAVHLKKIKSKNIMTKINKIVSIKEDASFMDAVRVFRESNFSRLPVTSKDGKTFLGLIHYKDVLFNFNNAPSIKTLIKSAIFIPESLTVFSIINVMNKEKRNMVFIIDEEGDILGLVTMEDILAIICGKGQDEYKHIEAEDEENEGIQYISHGVFRVKPTALLSELNDCLSLSFYSENYDTVLGLILEKCQYLPKENEEILIDGVKFKIGKIKGAKIEEVVIDKNSKKLAKS